MKLNYHDDNECFLLFGKDLNKIIAMLQILKDSNPNVEQLPVFIDQLIHMRSYDDMLDQMIMSTRAEDMGVRQEQKSKGEDETGMTLEEILRNLDLRLPDNKNGKN